MRRGPYNQDTDPLRTVLEWTIEGHRLDAPGNIDEIVTAAVEELAELAQSEANKPLSDRRWFLHSTNWLVTILRLSEAGRGALQKSVSTNRGAPSNRYRKQLIAMAVALRMFQGRNREQAIEDITDKWSSEARATKRGKSGKLAFDTIDDICKEHLERFSGLPKAFEANVELMFGRDPSTRESMYAEFVGLLDEVAQLPAADVKPDVVLKIHDRRRRG